MQRLEVSGAVRPLYGSLGVKGIIVDRCCEGNTAILWHVPEKSRFKIDGQEDAVNGQLEML